MLEFPSLTAQPLNNSISVKKSQKYSIPLLLKQRHISVIQPLGYSCQWYQSNGWR